MTGQNKPSCAWFVSDEGSTKIHVNNWETYTFGRSKRLLELLKKSALLVLCKNGWANKLQVDDG